MHRDPGYNISECDLAAKRVKHLFSNSKDYFRCFFEASIEHKYDHLKLPNLVSSLKKIDQQKIKKHERKRIHASSKLKKSKKRNGSVDPSCIIAQNHLFSLNQRYPFLFYNEKLLHLKKIQNIQLKNQLFAVKNFKKIAEQTQNWMYQLFKHQVKIIKDEAKENVSENAQNLTLIWEDLLKSKEDRQFNISRVIKYLSD